MENKVVLGMLGGMMEEKLLGSDESLEGVSAPSVPGSRIRVFEAALLIGVSNTKIQRLWNEGVLEGDVSKAKGSPIWLALDSVLAYAKERGRLGRSRLALKEGRLADVEFVDSDWLSTGEAAALIGVKSQTLTHWLGRHRDVRVERTSGGNARIEFRDIPKLIKAKGSPAHG